MISSTVCRRHERIRRKVSDFQQYVKRFSLQFKQKMATLLPLVKKQPGKMSELVKLVSDKEASPFNRRSLDGWLSYFREEVETLSKIQGLPNYCRNAGDFSSKLLNKVGFSFIRGRGEKGPKSWQRFNLLKFSKVLRSLRFFFKTSSITK